MQEVEGDGGAPRVRLGDLGGPVVEDPAAPRSTTRVPREGEDIGTTPVVRAFESMSVSDDPKHVGAAGKPDADVQNDPMPVSDAATAGEEWKDATPDSAAAGATPGATYTDKIKSAAAGTTEYGKKLATTVYEKVAGVGTVVVGKVQQVTQTAGTDTPGVAGGAAGSQSQDDVDASTTLASGEPATGGQQQQDKGVTVTGYIADKLRPGDEDRALSEAISGAVQRRKDDVAQRVPAVAPAAPGDTIAKVREAPAQVLAKARDAVTSLTGGTRVSDTVQTVDRAWRCLISIFRGFCFCRGGRRGGGIGAGDSRGGDRRDPTSAERKHDMKRCRNGSSRVCLYVATYTRVSVRKVCQCAWNNKPLCTAFVSMCSFCFLMSSVCM